jgi:serine protease Do
MKTKLVSTLILSLALSPAILRADNEKSSDTPKAEEPKKEEPKKEQPKKEESKKEEPKSGRSSEQKSEQPAEEKKTESDKGKDAPAQEKWSRETPEVLKAWEPALEDVRRATVKITRDGKDIAYGCAVHENGYIITKATEVHDKKSVFYNNLEVVFPEGLRLPVKLADVHRPYDLALLKVEARGLRPMKWDDSVQPTIGTFLAAATPMRLPAAVGVLSVMPRSLDETQKGYLGVSLDKSGEGIIKVVSVSSQSPASKAGLVIDDIIKMIDGKPPVSVEECIRTIGACRPYQKLKIVVGREKGDRELEVTLASRASNVGQAGEDPRNMMAGQLSRTRRGFPDAMQHDMVLDPQEIGGPIVDLEGHVVGMNIARSGRIECVAIPSKTLKTLLSKVGDGKFFHPELDALRDERKNAEEALNRLKKDLDTINGRIKDAEAPPEKKEDEK